MELSEQQEELEVLRSIFDESVLTIHNGEVPRGTVQIHPILPQPLFVANGKADEENGGKVSVHFLPPMTLYFKFVPSYPSSTSPAFLLTSQWLTFEQLQKLCQQLDFIWKEYKPEAVLYRWIRFLQEETLQFLGIHESLDISPLTSRASGPVEVRFSPTPKRKELSVRPKIPRQTNDGVSVVASGNQLASSQRKSARRPTTYSCYLAARTKRPSDTDEVSPQIENSHSDPNRDSRGIFQLPEGVELQSHLIQFNEYRQQAEFENEWFTCGVCYVDKQGRDGMRFKGCDHIYCNDCLQTYFTVQIQQGMVQGLICPEDKCESQALPHQVRDLVAEELFSKYDKMLLDSTLSQMRDITICPLKSCQCSLIIDQESKLASCPACLFSFCVMCRMTYHGLMPCRLYDDEIEGLVEKYLEADDDEQKELEKKYGRKEIKFLINEHLSREWVQSNSKKCPNCFASIQKIDGCNKMTCTKCNMYFCWICRSKLHKDTPYEHYNDPAFPSCVNQLYLRL